MNIDALNKYPLLAAADKAAAREKLRKLEEADPIRTTPERKEAWAERRIFLDPREVKPANAGIDAAASAILQAAQVYRDHHPGRFDWQSQADRAKAIRRVAKAVLKNALEADAFN